MFFADINTVLKGRPCRIVCIIDSLLLSVSFPLLAKLFLQTMYQLCFQHILNYVASHLLAVQERESNSKHAWNWVYISKIENSSYHQELVSHPISENFDELSNLFRRKLK